MIASQILLKSLLAANLFCVSNGSDAGVKTLPDILDKEEKFLTFTAFKERYKINTNFLCYIGLCNALQSIGGKSLDVMTKLIW